MTLSLAGKVALVTGAAAFMLLVGGLASLGPARRGLRIDPTQALRSEYGERQTWWTPPEVVALLRYRRVSSRTRFAVR